MLNNHQFQDVNNVVNALRDKGFILADRGRQTTKRSVKDNSGKTITCILPSKIDVEFASILGLTKDKSLIQNWTPANDNKAAKELLNPLMRDRPFRSSRRFLIVFIIQP